MQFGSYGLTATTPTLTPTTMRTLEEALGGHEEVLRLQGGFIPPSVDVSQLVPQTGNFIGQENVCSNNNTTSFNANNFHQNSQNGDVTMDQDEEEEDFDDDEDEDEDSMDFPSTDSLSESSSRNHSSLSNKSGVRSSGRKITPSKKKQESQSKRKTPQKSNSKSSGRGRKSNEKVCIYLTL